MTTFSNELVQRIRRDGLQVQLEGQVLTLRESNAREGRIHTAELELVDEAGAVLGYITPYGSNERGAVKASMFGIGLPALFRSLEDAIAEIIR